MKVLFVCVGNAGRSRIAETFYNALATDESADSAGTRPEPHPHPEVVAAMHEIGFDIGNGPGKLLSQEMLDRADKVITMGCNVEDACPGAIIEAEDWGLPDPAGKSIEEVRAIRDDIRFRVERLLSAN